MILEIEGENNGQVVKLHLDRDQDNIGVRDNKGFWLILFHPDGTFTRCSNIKGWKTDEDGRLKEKP